jgi:hypothetical protein
MLLSFDVNRCCIPRAAAKAVNPVFRPASPEASARGQNLPRAFRHSVAQMISHAAYVAGNMSGDFAPAQM